MSATSSKEIVILTTKNNRKIVMGLDEYARWLSIIEAMEYIDLKANDINMDLSKSTDWIKPLALQRYVRDRFNSMKHDVTVELKRNNS